MEDTTEKGFALVMVIVAVALVGLVMFVLAEDSKTMLFQADGAYLRAVERNLIASGLAWAKRSIEGQESEVFDRSVELDTATLSSRESNLSAFIDAPRDRCSTVHISTSCSKGRQALKHVHDFRIELQ